MNTVLNTIACGTLALTTLPLSVKAAVSNPLPSKGDLGNILPEYQDVKETEKKYYEHKIEKHHDAKSILDTETLDNSCNIGVRSKWSSSVGSGIFAAPVSYPSGIDGKKEIFVNTFYQYVEVLGHDGYKPWGFPLSFEDSSFQTSPVLYDVDDDGVNDMGVVDKNANLFWIRLGEFGQYLEDYHVQVPKLKIKRDWADGMDPKFVDNYVMTSMFDHDYSPFQKSGNRAKHDELEALSNAGGQASYPEQKSDGDGAGDGGGGRGLNGVSESRIHAAENVWQGRRLFAEGDATGGGSGGTAEKIKQHLKQNVEEAKALDQRRAEEKDQQQEEEKARHKADAIKSHVTAMHERIKDSSEEQHSEPQAHKSDPQKEKEQEDGDVNAQTAPHSLHIATPEELIHDSEESLEKEAHNSGSTATEAVNTKSEHHVEVLPHSMEREGEEELDDFENPDFTAPPNEWVDDDYHVDAEHAYAGRHHYGMHGDDMGYGGMGYGSVGGFNESNFVYVDPHVLSTPVLADVNNDGDVELVMAVSYYFDKFAIEHPDKLDYDPDNFIAGGVASWNIAKEEWSWLVHLDLTTDKTKFNALIYASPTVADIDGDGRKEIIIGTSLGLLYVLDGDSGFTRRFFPMQFHQIQAQVAVGDIMGGPHLEMIVGDLVGNLVCVNSDGDILWDARLSGAIYHAATIGDVNGDGQLDVIVSVAALEGYQIYAVHGDTGKVLPQFPIALPASAEISGPILLVDVYSYMSAETTASTSYTAGVPGGTITSRKSSRSFSVSSSTYDDPYVPKWTMDSRGHEPAPAPSENTPTPLPASEADADTDNHPTGHYEEEGAGGGERKLSAIRGSQNKADPVEKGRLSEREYANQGLSAEELKQFMDKSKAGRGSVPSPAIEHAREGVTAGLHLLVPSFDGHLYILDGHHSCAERVDIGEHISSTPLLDDIDANGLLDIVIGTLHGTVHVLETQIPAHPLNTWTSFPKDRGNGFTHGQTGLSIPSLEKKRLRYSDVKGGALLEITFDIWDRRRHLWSTTYTIVITKGTNKMEPIFKQEFTSPGRYTVSIPVAPPGEDSLVVGMYTDHGMYFEDHVDVAISTRFYVWVKYLALFPLGLLCVPLLLMRGKKESF